MVKNQLLSLQSDDETAGLHIIHLCCSADADALCGFTAGQPLASTENDGSNQHNASGLSGCMFSFLHLQLLLRSGGMHLCKDRDKRLHCRTTQIFELPSCLRIQPLLFDLATAQAGLITFLF
jgi:hypothetical protein